MAVRQLLGVPMTATAWTTLSISGDSKRELTLSLTEPATMLTHWLDQQRRQGNGRIADMFERPEVRWSHGFAEMSDAEYARNLAQIYAKQIQTAQIRHGIDYFCKDGWLVTDRHVPNYATVPVLDIRDQVRALLPDGTDVAGISADGPNHRLRVTADSPGAVSQLLRALDGSGDFRQVELLTLTSDGHRHSADILLKPAAR